MVRGDVPVSESMVLNELALMPVPARQQLLSDLSKMNKLVDDLYRQRKLIVEAERRHIETRPEVIASMEQARSRILIQALMNEVKTSLVMPDFEPLAREYYATHGDEFILPEMVRVRHILVAPRDGDKAAAEREVKEILALVKGGEEFSALAKSRSMDKGTAAKGGDTGWFEKGKMVKEFEQAAFALTNPGDISEVVETRFGYHILRLEDRRPSGNKPFNEVRSQIEEKLRNQFVREQLEQWNRQITKPQGAYPDDETIRQVFDRARSRYGLVP